MSDPSILNSRQILLGIGGGVAAYRMAETARLLMAHGANVRCVMTASAQKFISPLTFEALTGNAVHTELFALTEQKNMGHISLIRQADLLLVGPCTANLLAKFKHGIADDLLTTLFMAQSQTPVLLAPAMNPAMWSSAATCSNISTLLQRGIHIVGPDQGVMACGEQGQGRLSQPEDMVLAVERLLTPQLLVDQHWVINAGPTTEPWDAVRLLTNRASGRLGAIMARQAAMMGAKVTLIAGPGTPDVPSLVHRIDVGPASAMLQACQQAAKGADVFVATAAVSDYAFAEQHQQKLKRQNRTSLTVNLRENPDIVAAIARMEARPTCVVAFAAESEHHQQYAREKLAKKGVDAIVANDISNMGEDDASGYWLTENSHHPLPASSKTVFSQKIISHILELMS